MKRILAVDLYIVYIDSIDRIDRNVQHYFTTTRMFVTDDTIKTGSPQNLVVSFLNEKNYQDCTT